MSLKDVVKTITPSSFHNRIRLQKDLVQLRRAQRSKCKVDNLRSSDSIDINDIFNSYTLDVLWQNARNEFRELDLPDGTGGINNGDRRAIFYLTSAISPKSVLEIGTHIGVSTIHIASALKKSSRDDMNLTTVDIVDVNSPTEKQWLKHGTPHSPSAMINKMGCNQFVNFVTDTSINFAEKCKRTFDLIFLDGDHSAKTVYQEIPAALNLLSKDGVILLHDYFPDMVPLWSNGSVVPGPFLAIKALQSEGVNVTAIPLGELPWPTKLGSHVTSLALLLRGG